MTQQLFPDTQSTLEVDIPDDLMIDGFGPVVDKVLEDPCSATSEALATPLGFPPLGQAIVPGDRIAIALSAEVPCGAELVAGVITALENDEVLKSSDIQLVYAGTPQEFQQLQLQLAELLPAGQFEQLRQVIHQPDDSNELAYLAASHDASAIYLNRELCDADVVIPISSMKLDGQVGYVGIHDGLFPAFTDTETQKRFQVPANHQANQLSRDASEAAWLLGIQLIVVAIPGPADTILQVLAGLDSVVAEEAELVGRASWSRPLRQAEMVIATIEGDQQQQSWGNLARAIQAARQLVEDDGTLVICSTLACAADSGLARLTEWNPGEDLQAQLQQESSPDAMAAIQLALAREQAHVYLLSQLDQELVESLGIAHLSDGEEISRLGRQCQHCIFLSNAHRTVIQ